MAQIESTVVTNVQCGSSRTAPNLLHTDPRAAPHHASFKAIRRTKVHAMAQIESTVVTNVQCGSSQRHTNVCGSAAPGSYPSKKAATSTTLSRLCSMPAPYERLWQRRAGLIPLQKGRDIYDTLKVVLNLDPLHFPRGNDTRNPNCRMYDVFRVGDRIRLIGGKELVRD